MEITSTSPPVPLFIYFFPWQPPSAMLNFPLPPHAASVTQRSTAEETLLYFPLQKQKKISPYIYLICFKIFLLNCRGCASHYLPLPKRPTPPPAVPRLCTKLSHEENQIFSNAFGPLWSDDEKANFPTHWFLTEATTLWKMRPRSQLP